MPARKLIALIAAIIIGFSAAPAKSDERAYINLLIQYYADYYDVPVELVHRVVQRESTYNPRARNGPYWGLMQILPATARTMGFTGQPQDLLDAETNLIYAVKYLRGAYIVAEGNHDRAVQHYARGYYYDARDKGLLEVTGLRPGPRSPAAPTPPTQVAAAVAPPIPPARIPQFTAPVTASLAAPVNAEAPLEAPISIALGFLPPQRPAALTPEPATSPALAAIAAADVATPSRAKNPHAALGASILSASSFMGAQPTSDLKPSIDIFEGTFSLLDAIAGHGQGDLAP
jgi:hypothetical protein